MLFKFVTLALFLIVRGSFGQYSFGADQNKKYFDAETVIQKILEGQDYLSSQDTFMSKTDRKSHLLEFAQGFLEGVGTAGTFAEIKECIQTSEEISSDIVTAVTEIRTKMPEKVRDGIRLLGQAAEIVPNAVQACKATETNFEKLMELVQTFKNPDSFAYHISKSLLINHVEVITEVIDAVNAYEAQNYTGLGYWVGVAMDTIILEKGKKLNQRFADHLNQVSGWQAKLPKKFEGMTLEEIKSRYLGAQKIDYSKFDNLTEFNYEGLAKDIPANFSAKEQWPDCVHPIRDQGHCGSCWAFAASEVLSDRFCVASNGSVQVVLSPQYLISCDKPLALGCNGGVPIFSWWFMINKGVVTDDCLPYMSSSGKNPLSCSDIKTCQDGSPLKFYHALNKSAVILKGPQSIQANILQYGPIEAGFMVYEDFMYYSGGIYKHTSGAFEGLHAIKIIGWGNENGQDYWLVANSWGTDWGLEGYFKIAFGQCEIDIVVASGQADVAKLNETPNDFWSA